MNKTKSLIISGSIIIGVSFLLAIYFILIALGVIQIRSNKIIIETASLTSEYDGSDQYARDFKIIEGELLDGHEFEINYLGYQRDIGSSLNTASVKIIDDGLNDVTSNYELEVVHGSINVTKRLITFISESEVKRYDEEYLINDEYNILTGELMEGDYFSGESTSSIMLPGSTDNTFIMKIYNSENKDVTHNYEISYEYGRLEVEKISLTIASLSYYKVFDNTPLKYEKIDPESNSAPFGNIHRYEVTFIVPEFNHVGQIDNTFYLTVYDKETNEDVTNMYDITYVYGTLTILSSIYDDPNITNKPLDYNNDSLLTVNSTSNQSIYLRDISYGDYLGNKWGYATPQQLKLFNSPFNFVGKILNTHSQRKINMSFNYLRSQTPYLTPYFTTNNQGMNDIHNYGKFNNSKYEDYDVDYYNYNYLDDGIKRGDDIELESDIYRYTNHVRANYLNLDPILKERLLDIANINDINPSSNNLIRDIKEYIENVAKFDVDFDEFAEGDDYILYFLEHAETGIAQHFASAAVLMYRAFGIPARYVTGYYSEASNGKDVLLTSKNAHAWVEVYIEGMGWVPVEVTDGFDKMEITIKPKDYKKVYDDQIYTTPEDHYEVVEGELLEGHYIKITTKEKHINATIIGDIRLNNHIETYRIYDDNDNDVTNLYRVITEGGRVDIDRKILDVETDNATYTYNGESQSYVGTKVPSINNLIDGHTTDGIRYTSSIKNVGSVANAVTFRVYNSKGEDVTRNYRNNNDYGFISITPSSIVIMGTADQTIRLDEVKIGEKIKLKGDFFKVVSGEIYGDDFDKMTITGESVGPVTGVGTLEYQIFVEDKTKNYIFTTFGGIITILPPLS